MIHKKYYCKAIVLLSILSYMMGVKCSSWTNDTTHITGLLVVNEEVLKQSFVDEYNRIHIPDGSEVDLQLYGKFSSTSHLQISWNTNCSNGDNIMMHIVEGSDNTLAKTRVQLPKAGDENTIIYLCLNGKLQGRSGDNDTTPPKPWVTIKLVKPTVPLWLSIILIIILLSLSSLFSGLNLGLLSLDKTDLKVVINTGSQKQKSEALSLVPVRNHGNYLLCSLVFSNVLVNTVLTLVLDSVFVGDDQTVVFTTLLIVIFGEIMPQAICSRYGLTVGAKTLFITKAFMFITFPVSYPFGKFLDKVLGEDVGAVYTRDRLKELLKISRDQHGLENEEIDIISGTLDMKRKTVKDIMVPLDEVFMIPVDIPASEVAITLKKIKDTGFSRIPVYENKRENVIAIIPERHLPFLNREKEFPFRDLVERSKQQNPVFCVYENTRLDYMLQAFREGTRGHMAIVQTLTDDDDGPNDTAYKTIGLVTLEDVLEELLQQEIYDENDVERR